MGTAPARESGALVPHRRRRRGGMAGERFEAGGGAARCGGLGGIKRPLVLAAGAEGASG